MIANDPQFIALDYHHELPVLVLALLLQAQIGDLNGPLNGEPLHELLLNLLGTARQNVPDPFVDENLHEKILVEDELGREERKLEVLLHRDDDLGQLVLEERQQGGAVQR